MDWYALSNNGGNGHEPRGTLDKWTVDLQKKLFTRTAFLYTISQFSAQVPLSCGPGICQEDQAFG